MAKPDVKQDKINKNKKLEFNKPLAKGGRKIKDFSGRALTSPYIACPLQQLSPNLKTKNSPQKNKKAPKGAL